MPGVLVGHSIGSLTSIYATGTYHDADALVTTAFDHTTNPLPFDPDELLGQVAGPYIPARTFSKEFHALAFFHLPTTDPAALDFDYDHGVAIQARAQFFDAFRIGLNSELTRSKGVTVPVLVQEGDFDALQPSAYLDAEPAYYPNAASVTLHYLEDIGHNINAHLNRWQSWVGIDRWISEVFASR